MTTEEPAVESVSEESGSADPLAQWRHLPAPPRFEDLITSQPVGAGRGSPEPAGEPEHEFMLRYAAG